jgi:hypothetical protein
VRLTPKIVEVIVEKCIVELVIAELAVFPQVNPAGESCMHSVIRSGNAAVKYGPPRKVSS